MKLSTVLSVQLTQFEAVALKGDLTRSVAKIAALGYDGVELAVRDPKLLDADEVRALVQRHGLAVPAIGTGQAYGEEGLSFTDPDEGVRRRAIQRIKDHIDFATHFDALIIIGLIRGVARGGVSREQAMRWLVEALKECVGFAEERGVRLVLEPLNRYETNLINTVAEGLALIERVGAGHLGLLLDTFHMNIEEPSIEESVKAAKGRLLHVHVADSNRWYPGAGHLDFARIVAALRDIGYEGYLSAEILPLPDPDTCVRRTIEFLRGILGA